MVNLFKSQDIPQPVTTVAAALLLIALLNFLYSLFFFPATFFALGGTLKAVIGIAAAFEVYRCRRD